jgi:metallo-beta-lactamase family protein
VRISFQGAARQVTGSQYYLENDSVRFLVECGMNQGLDDRDEINRRPFVFDPAMLDFVVLTHAHLDHCGLLPRLYAEGYRGPIYCTRATQDLATMVLLDSAKIQEEDSKWEQRRFSRRGGGITPLAPIYTSAEAKGTLKLFVPCDYNEVYTAPRDVQVRFVDAGHILGSSSVEIWWPEGGARRKAAFSGDLGRHDRPIIRDPQPPEPSDITIVESTYGSRLHDPWAETEQLFSRRLQDTLGSGGHVLIPAFAIGRTQDVLFCLADLIRRGELPPVPVFADSPMATGTTEIFQEHTEIFDQATLDLMAAGQSPFDFPGLRVLRSSVESQRLNEMTEPFIVISASGMCSGGRIRHHLHHHLGHPNDELLFVGYQAEDTLGREIVDGAREVELFGQIHAVRCRVTYLEGFSAHADQAGLVAWAEQVGGAGDHIFLVHGEDESLEAFEDKLSDQVKAAVHIPGLGETFEV